MQAMVLFCGKSSFDKELLCPLKRLAESPHVSVRRSLACGLHEVSSASWLNLNVGMIMLLMKAPWVLMPWWGGTKAIRHEATYLSLLGSASSRSLLSNLR